MIVLAFWPCLVCLVFAGKGKSGEPLFAWAWIQCFFWGRLDGRGLGRGGLLTFDLAGAQLSGHWWGTLQSQLFALHRYRLHWPAHSPPYPAAEIREMSFDWMRKPRTEGGHESPTVYQLAGSLNPIGGITLNQEDELDSNRTWPPCGSCCGGLRFGLGRLGDRQLIRTYSVHTQ